MGYYLGAIDTTDNYRIGLFYYQIQHGNVARKRVGLRNLVKSFINPNWGVFDAALVVFDSGSVWRLSFVCDIKDENTAAKRFTYVFGESDNYYNTPVGRFDALQRNGISFENIKDAFSVERLNKDFFNGYKERYVKFLKHINEDTKENRDYVKKLLGRLVFLQFLQKKGWMGVPANQQGWNGGDKFYLNHLIERYEGNDRLLSYVLEPLFFNTLNEPRDKDIADSRLGENIKIPYLNGGLFDKDTLDNKDIDFPYDYFKELMDYFAMYNFTIDENDPEDSEIGIDPEMLGHIFENLLEDNKDKGAFYTPKEIVQYMSKESVAQYLKSKTPEEFHTAIDSLIKQRVVDLILQKKENARLVNKALCEVKVCDPAIGSGAFPMGVLNVLFDCRHLLYGFIGKNEVFSYAKVKRDIIQNNIYGVDIEKGAIDIARLRFWLTIVVDSDKPEALPNFDYKFMQGNSLLESFEGSDLSKIAANSVGRPSQSSQLQLNFDSKDNRRNLQILLKQYFGTDNHETKKTLRESINNEVKSFIKNSFGGNEDSLKRLDQLDCSENNRFFLWHTWFADVFKEGGFDIVIGNPPYLKEGRISKVIIEPYKNSPYYKGKMDLWYMFACIGIDMIKKDGLICLIATNNWTTSFGASKLRNKVISETRILNIVDFGAIMMFESASIQTMIMLFKKDKKTDDYTFDYRKLTAFRATEKDAIAILDRKTSNAEYYEPFVRRANYIGKNITFSKSGEILEQIELTKNTIHLNDNEIAQGIVFPQDRLNKKNQELLGDKFHVGQGIFVLTSQEKDALMLNNNELSLIKPYYTSENIDRYVVYPSNTLWTIYTDSKFKNKDSLNPFPNIKNHLDKFSIVFTSDNKPYGLHRAREEKFFHNEKIIVLRKSVEHPVFSYCNFSCFLSQSFNMIQTERVNMKYLTGLLNSKLIEFWLKNKGKMQGANYQLDKEPLMQLPIAVPSDDLQLMIAKLVDIIILLKGSNERASNLVSNNYLASEFEHLVNGCIYEIYLPWELHNSGIDIISVLSNYIFAIQTSSLHIEDLWSIYSSIDNTGIIERIKTLSLSESETLRTIALS